MLPHLWETCLLKKDMFPNQTDISAVLDRLNIGSGLKGQFYNWYKHKCPDFLSFVLHCWIFLHKGVIGPRGQLAGGFSLRLLRLDDLCFSWTTKTFKKISVRIGACDWWGALVLARSGDLSGTTGSLTSGIPHQQSLAALRCAALRVRRKRRRRRISGAVVIGPCPTYLFRGSAKPAVSFWRAEVCLSFIFFSPRTGMRAELEQHYCLFRVFGFIWKENFDSFPLQRFEKRWRLLLIRTRDFSDFH